MRTWLRGKVTLLFMTLGLLLAVPAVALADNVQNDVNVFVGNDRVAQGDTTQIGYRIAQNSGDGQAGCNVSDATPATVTINKPSQVDVDGPDADTNPDSPATLTFNSATGCGVFQFVRFSSNTPGNYQITVSVSDSGAGTYNTNPATFVLHVTSKVESVLPPNNATNVPVGAPVVANFSGAMFSGSFTSDTFKLVGPDGPDAGTDMDPVSASRSLSSDGKTATLDPTANLADNTTYIATLEGGWPPMGPTIIDANGNPLLADYSWSFTTGVSNTAPQVSVSGVTNGDSYPKGSVPNATCDVTDAQDGDSSFPAELSEITGPYASDDIGEQTASCSYTDSGGLTATASATYNIVDLSPPVINKVVTGTQGTNDWYTSNVSVDWTVSDPESPNSLQTSDCDDFSVTSDQNSTTYTCTATSAGGTSSDSVTIKRDATPPQINDDGTTQSPNGAGWFNTAVVNDFSASDAPSGLADSGKADFSESSRTAEGSAVKINSGPVSDNAGNTNPGIDSAAFQIDLTKPTIQASLVDGSNNPLAAASTGWYNLSTGAPTAHYTCDDVDGDGNAANGGASGVASCGPDHTFGSAANPQSNTGTVTDNAGHSDTRTVNDVKVDLSKPTNVQFAGGPAADGSYDPDSVPAAPTCTADDTFSNLKDCVVTGYSANAGTHTLTATATDNAGNVETATRKYEVKGWALKGFYHPVDMLITNTVKAGQTVPLKFEMLEQVSGDERTNPADVKTFTQKVTCGTFTPTEDAIEEYSSGSTSLRYDTTGGQFIFNWQTPKAAGSCFKVTLTPNDTSSNTLVANFKLK